ncbi:hypothetical protein B0T11DRAFT_143078 [Plectosphaerella cucumerina]|uniref:Uncharacterized protein n=1 Tax=Plectosphaerella cucumerina TaxID=40658 RepID=A0A8K0T5M8_9PEZI|nr:hypothetical protein B0T11DRAFT_143078 [Plectosphaerella cucumerina]
MCCPTGQRPSMRWGLSASGLWHAAGCQRPDRQDQPPSTTRGALAACSHVCPSMQEAACISWYGNGPQTDQNLRKPRLDSTRSTLSAAPLCLFSALSRHRKDSADDRHSACTRNLSWGRRCVALARTPERTKYLISTCRAVLAVRSWCCLSRLRPHRPFARLTRPPSLVVWYCSSSTRQTEPAVGVDVLFRTALVRHQERSTNPRPPDNNTGRTRINPVVPASYWSRKDLGLPSSHLSQRTAPPETLFLHACPHLRSSMTPSIHFARQYGSPLGVGKYAPALLRCDH